MGNWEKMVEDVAEPVKSDKFTSKQSVEKAQPSPISPRLHALAMPRNRDGDSPAKSPSPPCAPSFYNERPPSPFDPQNMKILRSDLLQDVILKQPALSTNSDQAAIRDKTINLRCRTIELIGKAKEYEHFTRTKLPPIANRLAA